MELPDASAELLRNAAAARAALADRPRKALTAAIVAGLLLVHYALAVTAVSPCHLLGSLGKSNTYDEIAHITGGYTYWKLNDYRFNPEGGVLGQRLMAVPLLLADLRLPPLEGNAYWRTSDLWNFSYQFFYTSGNDPEKILLISRSFMAAFSVALGLVVYFWARGLFGRRGGLLALALFAFCPTFLANSPLATMDLLASLCFLAAMGAFWRMLHRLTPATLAASCLALATLFLAKFSAPLIAPMLLIALLLRLAWGGPLVLKLRGQRQLKGLPRLGVLAASCVLHVLVVWAVIWLAYACRYDAFEAAQKRASGSTGRWRRTFRAPIPVAWDGRRSLRAITAFCRNRTFWASSTPTTRR